MKVDIDVVPSTMEQAVGLLLEGLAPEDRTFIAENNSSVLHGTVGRAMRNSWSLWDPTMPLATWFRRNLGLGHADDMSAILLEALWCRVLGREHALQEQVEEFKLHWELQGQDPAFRP